MGKDADCCDTCRMFGGEQHQASTPPPTPPPSATAQPDQIKLVVLDRAGEEREIVPAGRTLSVGRGKQCDLQIDDFALSRVQCVLLFDEHGVFIKDSGSTCGTYVDGRLIGSATKLRVGSKIYFGNTQLRVVAR